MTPPSQLSSAEHIAQRRTEARRLGSRMLPAVLFTPVALLVSALLCPDLLTLPWAGPAVAAVLTLNVARGVLAMLLRAPVDRHHLVKPLLGLSWANAAVIGVLLLANALYHHGLGQPGLVALTLLGVMAIVSLSTVFRSRQAYAAELALLTAPAVLLLVSQGVSTALVAAVIGLLVTVLLVHATRVEWEIKQSDDHRRRLERSHELVAQANQAASMAEDGEHAVREGLQGPVQAELSKVLGLADYLAAGELNTDQLRAVNQLRSAALGALDGVREVAGRGPGGPVAE